MTDPKMSIIIPFYNRWDLTHARLMDIYKYAPEWCEVILINDASTENDCERGIKWWKDNAARHTLRFHRNEVNVGFGASHNNGAKLAQGDILVFLSNDVVITGDVFTRIVEIVGEDDKLLLGGRIVDWKAGWNQFTFDGVDYCVPYAEGWLIACIKPAWKQLGGWDTRYGKFDYEDVDLSMNALVSGYNIVALNSKLVQHIGSQTISGLGLDRMEITKTNRQLFIDKWRESFRLISDNWSDNEPSPEFQNSVDNTDDD